MEFLRAVEDDLRALSVEARKKHPVVKEAAERGIVRLRGLREQYAAAVRESGGESPPTSRLRSQELLRPFLLACNHVDAGKAMTLHALGAIAHLMNRDAISPADAPNILRVLAIQAVAPSSAANAPDVQVKVLQTLLLTVTWRGCELPEEVLASALIVCLQLAEHRHATVRNAASATLRQVVSLLFDRVAGEELGGLPLPSPSRSPRGFMDEEGMASGEDAALEESGGGAPAWARGQQQQEVLLSPRLEGMQPVERCAYYLIQDLCLICRGEGGMWLKHMVVPPALGMELIEQILAQHPRLFRERAEFGEVLRNQVCPLIVQTLRSGESELDFPLLVRLMRTIATVLGELGDALVPQCEVILAMLFQLLAGADLASAGGGGGAEGGGGRSGGGSSMVGAAASNLAATANSLLGAAVASLGSGGGGSGGGSSGAGAEGGGSGGRGRSGRMGLWTVMLALEVMGGVCAQPGLVLAAFANYDSLAECTDVLAGMVRGLSRFVVEGSLASPPAAASLLAAAASCPWSAKGLPQLPRSFELLKETAPPAITEGEVLLQAVGVLLALVETLWGIVLERQLEGLLKPAIPSARMHHPGGHEEEQEGEESPGALLHRMLVKEDVWQDLLRVLAHLLTHVSPPSPASPPSSSNPTLQSSPADRLFDHALLGLERFSLSLGVLGVRPAQTQALALAAKLAVPTLASELTSPMTTLASSGGASYTLTPRHFRAVKCLLRVVTFLANGLGGKGWESVVEAFDLLDACLYASGAPAASSPPGSEGDTTAGAASGAAAPDGRGAGVEEQKLANVLRRFICFSALLEDAALVHLVGAYISHGEALLQAEESPPFNGGGGGGETPARATRQASSAPSLLPASSSASAASTIPPPPGPASGPAAAAAAVAAPDRSVTAAALVLRQVVQAAAFNAYRYELIATAVSSHLAFAAGTHNPMVRVYAVASLADLLTKALSRTEEGGGGGLKERLDAGVGYPVLVEAGAGVVGGGGIGMVGYDLETLFLVRAELEALPSLLRPSPPATTAGSGAEDGGREVGPQVRLLRPLASLGACPYVDERAHALQALYRVLQSCGHVLNDGWAEVFDLLCTVAASASPPPLAAAAPAGAGASSPRPVSAQGEGYGVGESPPAFGSLPAPLPVPAVPALWGDACLPLAFRSLKLVVDDNLDSVPRPHLGACVRCMGAFAAQALDVNVSLTAVGMVWSVADFVARPDTSRGLEGDAAAATDEGVVWPAILGELGKLALDPRPEVRNCAVNTLFACLVGHGPAFAPEGWGARARAVEGLVAAIEERAWAASGEELSGTVGASATTARGRLAAPKVVMHHSRDTAQKQWAETRVLAMQGLGRLHRAFLRPFWAHAWYGLLWTRTLAIAAAAVGSGARAPNAEVALAGANLLFLQLQLASKAGLAHGPLRAAAGMKVVDGALQQAASGSASPPSLRQRGQSAPDSPDGKGGGAASEEFEAAKAKLWEEAWAALRGAAGGYCEDQEGEVAAAFVLNLQTIYEGARGQELQGPGRMQEFLKLLDYVIEARLPLLPPLATTAGSEGGASAGLGGRNWRPPVLPNQREALTLLRAIRASDARVWGKVFALLTRLATAPHATSVSSTGADDVAAAAAAGAFTRVPVSKQFAKEAADCLMELYGQDHVPLAARAGAFDAIVRSLGGACLACARARRGRRRGEWARLLLAQQSGGGVGAEQAGTEQQRRASVSLPQPLSVVQGSGALLTPVLLQGLEAVRACSLAAGNEEQPQQSGRRRGRSRSKEEEDRQSEKERQMQLQRAWHHAVLAVEGYLVPWTPEEAEGQQAANDVEPAAQQPGPHQQLVNALLAGGGGEAQEEGYGSVGAELLRSVVASVVGSLDLALVSGAVNQLVDLLVDALLAQSSLVGLGAPQASEAGESAAAVAGGAHAALFQGVMAHLRGLLDALVDRAVQPPVASRRPPTTTAPQRQQSGGKAAGKDQEAGEGEEEEEGKEEEEVQARVRAMAVRSTRRLVAGLLHGGRRIIERYQAESKRADAPPDAYVTAEAHVLALLALLQSFRLPDWALPLAAPTSALLGRGPDERSVLLPEWVALEESPAQEQAEEEDDEEEELDDGDYHLLQRGAAHPLPAHIFLLASPILDGCVGGSASSVVRAAALAALGAADVGGTFLRMRKEVDRHRRALDDAGVEIAQLRDETARLSVSSVGGLFF